MANVMPTEVCRILNIGTLFIFPHSFRRVLAGELDRALKDSFNFYERKRYNDRYGRRIPA